MKLKVISEREIQQNKFSKLANNLDALLKMHNLNANKFAQILGIPMMTIRRLISGETTDPRISTIKLVADYFNISVDALIEGDNQIALQSVKNTKSHLVPKLKWETIEEFTEMSEINLRQWDEWQSITIEDKDDLSGNAFALESRPSMYPRFPQGTIFIIDPSLTPKDGDIVLIKLRATNKLTLRELTIDPPEWKLHPVVSSSNILLFSEIEHEIIGINLLTMLYNRRI